MLRKIAHGILDFVEKISRLLYAVSKIVYVEFFEGKGNNIFKRLHAVSLGYTTNLLNHFKACFADKYRYCLSEFDVHYRLRHINDPYGPLIVDKHIMHTYLRKYEEFLPELYFHVSNGRFKADGTGGNSAEQFISLLKRERRLVFKNTDIFTHGGFMVCLMEYSSDEDQFFWNKKVVDKDKLIEKIMAPGDYVIVQYVEQAEYSAKIYPYSVNTIRIITLYEIETDECWIADATHRFGTKRSGFVDNVAMGGISVGVDVQTGALKQGMLLDTFYKIKLIDKHPDTGVSFGGVAVENWLFIREKIKEIAHYSYKTPFIGWDIAVIKNGFKIIEINDRPDIQLNQFHRPMLKDERNRRFFAKYNVKPK